MTTYTCSMVVSFITIIRATQAASSSRRLPLNVLELFYSKIAPDLGIDVLRRGLAASKRKHLIAEDLGYILRDEGRDRQAAEMFQIAADEEVSSYFVYGELARLYGKLGEKEKHRKYTNLFERAGRS